jgi:hypothetical protein
VAWIKQTTLDNYPDNTPADTIVNAQVPYNIITFTINNQDIISDTYRLTLPEFAMTLLCHDNGVYPAASKDVMITTSFVQTYKCGANAIDTKTLKSKFKWTTVNNVYSDEKWQQIVD